MLKAISVISSVRTGSITGRASLITLMCNLSIPGALFNPFQTVEEWRTVFWITFLIYVMGTLVFNTLMSGDRQEWDKVEGVSSESSSDSMSVTSR